MDWIRLRPSGGGSTANLIHMLDYSFTYSGSDRTAHDNFADITPSDEFVLPWTPDAAKTYQVICLNEQVTGSCEVTSSDPETDAIASVGCSMIGYIRITKVAGGYYDHQVGSFSAGTGINSGSLSASCGLSTVISDALSGIESRLVVGEILSGIVAENTTVSRSVAFSGQLWLVEY